MTDPTDPAKPDALTDEPQADAMAAVLDDDGLTKMTHEVDTDDMFRPGS